MAKESGLKEVPCIVRKVNNPSERLEIQLIENLQRNDMSFRETIDGINRLIYEPNYLNSKRKGERYSGIKKIAKIIGRSETWISQLLSLDKNAPNWLKQEIDIGKTSISKALKIMRDMDMKKIPKEKIKKVNQVKDILNKDIKKLSGDIEKIMNKIELQYIKNNPNNINQIKTIIIEAKEENLKQWQKLEKKMDYWERQYQFTLKDVKEMMVEGHRHD